LSELQRRIAVAAVAIPVVLAVAYFADAGLATLLGIIAALGAREFFTLVRAEGVEPIEGPGVALAALIPLGIHAERLGVFRLPAAATLTVALALLAGAIWWRGPSRKPLTSVAVTVFGVLYVSATIGFAYRLRYHEYTVGPVAGVALLFYPLVLTWLSDTAAYTFGRKLGRRKLIPDVSPGKTVEGAIAALVVAAIVSVVYSSAVLRPLSHLTTTMFAALLFGVGISVVGQVGDLAESLLKRSAGVKDSGTLLPGHGGVLDRMDALYFVLPVSYLWLSSILIPAP
jgi:phosphatidate cytidylyltransferase